MARLESLSDHAHIYLKAFHRFGRLTYSVDTLLNSPEISRIHAVIEWLDDSWVIRDLSKNGVWLNKNRVLYNNDVALSEGDVISFANADALPFAIVDLAPPKDMLLPFSESIPPKDSVIYLEKYHMLPSDEQPEVIVYFDAETQSWCYENTDEHTVLHMSDGQQIRIADKIWQLYQTEASLNESTVNIQTEEIENQLEFLFSLSLDEEQAELKIKRKNDLYDFNVRSHHYLTLLLARYKLQHADQNFAEDVSGWISVKQLARDLGVDENHLNIQIHRARKQFVEQLKDKSLAELIIERKRGKVRFGGKHFRIFKGAQVECSTIN